MYEKITCLFVLAFCCNTETKKNELEEELFFEKNSFVFEKPKENCSKKDVVSIYTCLI